MTRLFALSLAGLVAAAGSVHAAPTPTETLRDATEVLTELQNIPNKSIPANLVAEAQAIVVIPRVVKAGFVVAGRGGHGVALTRGQGGGWGEPTFVNIGGASVGLQVGVQATDLVLVFRNKKALDRILDGKGKLTLGADVGVAAGPVGRRAEAGTDGQLKAEILSYSRSRGVFAGVSLEGAVLHADNDGNRTFAADPRPETKKAAEALMTKVAEMGAAAPAPAGDRPLPPPGGGDRPPPGVVPDRP